MSYYDKHQPSTLLALRNRQRKVLRALAAAELETDAISAEAYKSDLNAGQKHSSATLLRGKLKGQLVRQLQKI